MKVFVVSTHVYNYCEGADYIDAICTSMDSALTQRAIASTKWRHVVDDPNSPWDDFSMDIKEMEVIK